MLGIRIVESFEDVLQILVEEDSFIIDGDRITVEGKKVPVFKEIIYRLSTNLYRCYHLNY